MQHFGAICARLMIVLAALACAAIPFGPTGGAAFAQGARGSTTVTRFILLAESPTQSVFKLSVSPSIPPFETDADDPVKPVLTLPSTARSGEPSAHYEYRGLVRTVDVEPAGGSLAVRFGTTAPSKIKAVASGQTGILVTIDKLTGAEAIGSRPVDTSGDELVTRSSLPAAMEPNYGAEGYEMIFLKYADVSEVVGLLTDGVTVKPNNVFIRREPGFGSIGSNSNTGYAPPQQAAPDDRPLGQAVDSRLAIDRRLNAIWVRGSPDEIARVKDQIALIDVPVDSVILETQFVELTEQGARAVGFDFTNSSGQLVGGTVQYGSFVPFGLDPEKIQPSFNFQAALYAQVQKGEGRIVSRPRIAAQSGSTAKIITGDALPILTAITLSGVNGVSQQVQYVNVGVTLQIAPRVSPDGYVTSHIYGVVSSVTGYSQGYPTISQREAETSASVRDGETFVIGGLTQENSLSTKSKVPILGDIPLLGQAFRNTRSTRSKTELYIVITPYIVRHRRFDAMDPNGGPLPGPVPLQSTEN